MPTFEQNFDGLLNWSNVYKIKDKAKFQLF